MSKQVILNEEGKDIFKAIAVLCVVAVFAQTLNFVLDGSGADYMTLRYGNGNPFAFLLNGPTPALYYVVLGSIAFGGTAAVIAATIGIRALVDKRNKKLQSATEITNTPA